MDVTIEPPVVIGPEGPRPFMRGILVHSLVSRGVPFDVAFDTAVAIEDRISTRRKVTREELGRLVVELLGEGYDPGPPPARSTPEPAHVIGPQASSEPFSKGILAVSLQGAGLDPSDAYDVAHKLELRLLNEGRREIMRAELRQLVTETIERTHGSGAADRYRVWRQALEEGRPIFVLLGGSTGVGKTSIAVEVARRLEITRILSTDSIRQIMRLMFSPDLMPEIHCSTFDAAQALKPALGGGRNAVILGFREQARKVAVGVHALLDRAVEENTHLILEGVNLLPSILDLGRYRNHAQVVFQVVATLDRKAYRSRFAARAARARGREPRRYIKHFSEILAIQKHILHEAEQYGLPIIDNVEREKTILSVIRAVIVTLQKSIDFQEQREGF